MYCDYLSIYIIQFVRIDTLHINSVVSAPPNATTIAVMKCIHWLTDNHGRAGSGAT